MSIYDVFTSSTSNDPDVLTREVLAEVLNGDLTLDDLYPAVYMAASAHLNQHRRIAESAHFTARRARLAAQHSGDQQRIAVAAFDELAARKAYLIERIHLGEGRYVLVGDATVADWDDRIAWIEAHELGPAQQKIAQARQYQADIREAGVTCLRELP